MKKEMAFYKNGPCGVTCVSDGKKTIAALTYEGHSYAFDIKNIPPAFKNVVTQALKDPHPGRLPLTADESKKMMAELKPFVHGTQNALKVSPVFALSKEEQQGYAQAQKNIATIEQRRKQANDNYRQNHGKLGSSLEPQLESVTPNGARIYDTRNYKTELDQTNKFFDKQIAEQKQYQQNLLKKQDKIVSSNIINHNGPMDNQIKFVDGNNPYDITYTKSKQATLSSNSETALGFNLLKKAGIDLSFENQVDQKIFPSASAYFKQGLNCTANQSERHAQINPASSHLTNTLAEVYQISAIQNPRAQTH